jgi:hypothetical protein
VIEQRNQLRNLGVSDPQLLCSRHLLTVDLVGSLMGEFEDSIGVDTCPLADAVSLAFCGRDQLCCVPSTLVEFGCEGCRGRLGSTQWRTGESQLERLIGGCERAHLVGQRTDEALHLVRVVPTSDDGKLSLDVALHHSHGRAAYCM